VVCKAVRANWPNLTRWSEFESGGLLGSRGVVKIFWRAPEAICRCIQGQAPVDERLEMVLPRVRAVEVASLRNEPRLEEYFYLGALRIPHHGGDSRGLTYRHPMLLQATQLAACSVPVPPHSPHNSQFSGSTAET